MSRPSLPSLARAVRARSPRLARFIAAALAAVLVVVPLASCSSKKSGNAEVSSDAIISVNSVEPTTELLPGDIADTAGWKIVTQVFDGLVTFSTSGDLEYDDAESITPNSDATEYTIKLKSGRTFSNGEAVTATSYARAWSYAANAANGQLGAAIFATIKGYDELQDAKGDKNAQLSGLKVVDDTTLDVTLKQPDSSFPYKVGDVAFLPLPSVAYDDMDAFGKAPIGNGPYVLQSWTPDQSIELRRNDKYTGPRNAQNGGISFRVYSDLNTAYADLQSGNLDVLDQIPTSALSTYQSDSTINAYTQNGPAFKSITIPQNLEHFSGQEGALRREAISMAIDRASITSKVMYGSATPATDFLAPTISGYSDKLDTNGVLTYNADKAKQLWAQADAISPWSGTFRIAYNADGDHKQWVDAVANSIKNVLGIDAQGESIATSKDFSTQVNERTIGAAFRSGIQSDYPHPEGYLVQGYDSSSADGKGLNNGDYKSAQFDEYMDEAAKQTDLNESIATYQKAEQLLLTDLPVIPLWYANVNAGSSLQMQDVEFNYMGLLSYYQLTKR
ncbi:MAG: ABC transporter substrate-binding protein [Bifidobacteriaceae bacterium]|nr:ABC transporter substrate-binding protein [Bifidobacteriaceae bacterium]